MANEEHLERLKEGLVSVLASHGGWDHGACLDDPRIPGLSCPGFLSKSNHMTLVHANSRGLSPTGVPTDLTVPILCGLI
jgi:hypothetical protein